MQGFAVSAGRQTPSAAPGRSGGPEQPPDTQLVTGWKGAPSTPIPPLSPPGPDPGVLLLPLPLPKITCPELPGPDGGCPGRAGSGDRDGRRGPRGGRWRQQEQGLPRGWSSSSSAQKLGVTLVLLGEAGGMLRWQPR